MKQHIITTYEFSELSEEAQKTAIQNLSDINVNREWWDYIYEELEGLEMECMGFDIDRGICKLNFKTDHETIAKAIIDGHGKTTQTYRDAEVFLTEYNTLLNKYGELEGLYNDHIYGRNVDSNVEKQMLEISDKMILLEEGFENAITDDYLQILKAEYEYLTSDKAIEETIIANEYQFLENGGII
jgi:hypothetical protein